MSCALKLGMAPILLILLAVTAPPQAARTEATPSSDRAEAYANRVTSLDRIEASGEASWGFDSPAITAVPPPPPPRAYIPRDYGPVPALSGPILLTGGKYIGTPYLYGGSTPAGFDCSGFVRYVYAENGVTLPRTADGIRDVGTVIPASQAQPGDVLYWDTGHVALYVAPGWRLDANRPGSTVQTRPIFGDPTYLRLG